MDEQSSERSIEDLGPATEGAGLLPSGSSADTRGVWPGIIPDDPSGIHVSLHTGIYSAANRKKAGVSNE